MEETMQQFTGSTLSVRQPWADCIAFAGKDVENRSYMPNIKTYPHKVLIHATKKPDMDFWTAMIVAPNGTRANCLYDSVYSKVWRGQLRYGLWKDEHSTLGAIIAIGYIDQVSQSSTSEWAMPNCWHWHLKDVRPIVPIPYSGVRRFNANQIITLDVTPLERVG